MRRVIVTGFLAALIALSAAAIPAQAKSTARSALAARLPQATLTDVSLSDALDFLRDTAGLNILVDWKSLDAINIGKDALVNLNLHDVAAGKLLSLILAEAGGDRLTWYLDDDVIQITTQAVADQQMITVMYDVTDLVSLSDTFTAGGGGAGSGAAAAQKIIKLIESHIRPEIWKDNARGGPATIDYFNHQLIIYAPRSVQYDIGG